MKNQFPLGWTPQKQQLVQSNQVPNLLYIPPTPANQIKPGYILQFPAWIDEEVEELDIYLRMMLVFKMV